MRQEQQLERLIQSTEQGNASSRERLFTMLKDKLHRFAQRELCRSRFLTLSPAAVLQETYLNLARRRTGAACNRVRFVAHSSSVMPGFLIGYLRTRRASCCNAVSGTETGWHKQAGPGKTEARRVDGTVRQRPVERGIALPR